MVTEGSRKLDMTRLVALNAPPMLSYDIKQFDEPALIFISVLATLVTRLKPLTRLGHSSGPGGLRGGGKGLCS